MTAYSWRCNIFLWTAILQLGFIEVTLLRRQGGTPSHSFNHGLGKDIKGISTLCPKGAKSLLWLMKATERGSKMVYSGTLFFAKSSLLWRYPLERGTKRKVNSADEKSMFWLQGGESWYFLLWRSLLDRDRLNEHEQTPGRRKGKGHLPATKKKSQGYHFSPLQAR